MIKEITEQDSNITTKITTEELSKQINDLKEKDAVKQSKCYDIRRDKKTD